MKNFVRIKNKILNLEGIIRIKPHRLDPLVLVVDRLTKNGKSIRHEYLTDVDLDDFAGLVTIVEKLNEPESEQYQRGFDAGVEFARMPNKACLI